jgi:hypothetical protein
MTMEAGRDYITTIGLVRACNRKFGASSCGSCTKALLSRSSILMVTLLMETANKRLIDEPTLRIQKVCKSEQNPQKRAVGDSNQWLAAGSPYINLF